MYTKIQLVYKKYLLRASGKTRAFCFLDAGHLSNFVNRALDLYFSEKDDKSKERSNPEVTAVK